jgi:glutamate racemase
MSRVYEIEIDKRRQDLAVFSEPCPGLAGLIELGAPADELKVVVDGHVDALRRRIGRHPDKAILGCTHYEIVAELFAAALPAGTSLIHQPSAVAEALERYFARHPEFHLGDSGRRDFLTTGQAGPQSDLVSQFWGAPLTFDQA